MLLWKLINTKRGSDANTPRISTTALHILATEYVYPVRQASGHIKKLM